MGTAAGFHTHQALSRQGFRAQQNLHVFPGIDVIGDDGHVVVVTHALAEHFAQGGFAGANRTADANAKGIGWRCHRCKYQER